MDTEFVLCELCMVDLRLECAGRVDSCSGIVNLEPRMRLTRQLSPRCVNRIKYQYYPQLNVHMRNLKFCVYMTLSRRQAKAGSQHAVPLSVHFAQSCPTPGPNPPDKAYQVDQWGR